MKKTLMLLDSICLIFSPLAIVAFVFFCIILLDGFGEHMQFLGALDEDGVEVTATLTGLSSDGKMAFVDLPGKQTGFNSVILVTKYYAPQTLAALQVGQKLRVRYVFPPQHEQKGILADHQDEVRTYTGYLTDLIWPVLLSWIIIVLHPEFLYLGLVRFDKEGAENWGAGLQAGELRPENKCQDEKP